MWGPLGFELVGNKAPLGFELWQGDGKAHGRSSGMNVEVIHYSTSVGI